MRTVGSGLPCFGWSIGRADGALRRAPCTIRCAESDTSYLPGIPSLLDGEVQPASQHA